MGGDPEKTYPRFRVQKAPDPGSATLKKIRKKLVISLKPNNNRQYLLFTTDSREKSSNEVDR
jgi:hypothetical protein